jgi:hypothetical protein
MLVDLRNLREPLVADIRNSLEEFLAEYPNTPICTIGLFGDGFHGSASLHLDTPDHSAAFVKEWVENGIGWCGEDSQGHYCNSCWDFPHCIGEFAFSEYPDLYQAEVEFPVDYINLDGTKAHAQEAEGDEGMHRILFPLLKAALRSFEPFGQLYQVAPFRVGVQMRDSDLKEFWLLKVNGKGG